MKLDQEEQQLVRMERERVTNSSRRSFLQKSSAAALVTTLAAQPVWGKCTVSGAMSGGSVTQDNRDDYCTIPEVWGRSPGFWMTLLSHNGDGPGNRGRGNAQGNGNNGNNGNNNGVNASLASAFPLVEAGDLDTLRCFIRQVMAEAYFDLPPGDTVPGEHCNVAAELASPGGVKFQLAAIWLDAYFGFFAGHSLPGRDAGSPQEWVEHFYALTFLAGDLGDAVFAAVFSGDATTQWNELAPGMVCV